MRKTFLLLAVAVAVLLLGQTGRVFGYALEGQKWPNGFITMNLQLSAATYPLPDGGLSDGSASWNDVGQGALDDWNQYLVNVQFSSNTNALTPKSGDKINTVFFWSNAFGQSFGSDAIAVTMRRFSGATNTEDDVIVNTNLVWDSYRGDLDYSYYYGDYIYDLRRVLDHEFGHVLGLNHPDLATPPQDVAAVMNSVVSDLDHIAADDISGAMFLYGNKPILASVTAMASPTIGGVVTGGGNFPVGSTQQLVAKPAPGYDFDEWEDSSTNPVRSITVQPGGATYQATFKLSLDDWHYRYAFANLNSILYANNQFYAFGSDQWSTTTIITSPDGVTWTPHPRLNFSLFDVIYANGKFICISGSNIRTSTDGLNWTLTTNTSVNSNGLLAYGNGIYVANGDLGLIYGSTDGVNWTTGTGVPNGYWLRSLTYGNGKFVAIGQVVDTDISLVSTDGVHWTATTLGQLTTNGTGLTDVNYGNGMFIATSPIADFIYYSTDGIHWTGVTYPGAGTYEGEVETVTYGDGLFYASTDYETLVSTEGINWTLDSTSTFYGTQVIFANNTFVSISSNEIIQSGPLIPPGTLTAQTINFPSINAQTYGVAPITLGATATSSLPVTYTVVSGPATISGNKLTVNGAGTIVVAADQLGNTTFSSASEVTQSITVNPATLTITANSLSKVTGQTLNFTGTEFSTTGLQNGETVPLAELSSTGAASSAGGGNYPIVVSGVGGGTFNPANYTINYADGTLSVSGPKTVAKVTLGNLVAGYDQTAHAVTATTNPAGLTVNVTYNGSTTAPTAVGTYTVVATINDTNYSGTATGKLVISKGTATVTFGTLAQTYDGTAKSATATTSPQGGLNVTFTYSGKATAPINAGSYSVVATVNDTNYTGSAKGTLVITKATVGITLGNLAATYTGKGIAATATVGSPTQPVTITYNGKATLPVNAGTYAVIATVNTTNYANSATGNLVISPASAAVTLSNLTAQANGKAHPVTVTTVPAGVAATVTYNGSVVVPSALGSYSVVATISNPNYTGSASGTLNIVPVLPIVATGTATAISAGDAILNGTVNPQGVDAHIHFEYGTTTAYGSQTLATDAGTGGVTVPVAIQTPPVNAGLLYHYRAVAVNTYGTIYGADKTFKALFTPAFESSIPIALSAGGAEVSTDINPDGAATTIHFEYGKTTSYGSTTPLQNIGAGNVAINVFALFSNLEPGTPYHYRIVTTGPAGTFYGPDETFTTLGFDTELVVQKGQAATGTPTTFAAFGPPAINVHDGVAFAGTLTAATGITAANNVGIWADDSTGTRQLVARTGGATAPDTSGVFATLSDPAYSDSYDVAFRGTLKVAAGQATATTAAGVWSNCSGALRLVARQGSAAPGTSGTFAAFTSLAQADGATFVFATLNAGSGITAANNTGIWRGTTASDLTLFLQLGQTVGGKTITKLNFLAPAPYVSGQTRSFNVGQQAVCGATFSDKTTGLIEFQEGASPRLVISSAVSASGTTGTFASFGTPALNELNVTAFAATFTLGSGGTTSANNSGIWLYDGLGQAFLLARTGDAAPGVNSTFATLSDPVTCTSDAVAFRGTLKPVAGVVTAANATGIWCNSNGPLQLVIQQGAQAPGCPAGATFATFPELALPDQGGAENQGGIIMLATLNASAAANVTASNNTGIWAVDTSGALQLIIRTGDNLNGKTVTALSFLTSPAYVGGQGRSYAQSTGDLVYMATFSDKSTAIFSVTFPVTP